MGACKLWSVFLSFFLSSLLGTRMSPPRNSDVATLWSVFLSSLLGTRNSDVATSELGCCHPLICLTRMSPPSDLSYSELGCCNPLICLTRNSDVDLSFFLSFFFTWNSELGCRHLGTRMLPPSDLSYSDVATLWSVLLGTRMSPPSDLSYSELGCCHPLICLSFFLSFFFTRNSELGCRHLGTRMLPLSEVGCRHLGARNSELGTRNLELGTREPRRRFVRRLLAPIFKALSKIKFDFSLN